jgi:polar amino acid transport system substrate-binding protein
VQRFLLSSGLKNIYFAQRRSSVTAVLICSLFALAFFSQPAFAEKINVLSPDYWCPFGCKAGTDFEGYPLDILKAIFEPQGIKIEYANMNYSRAIVDVRKGKYAAIPSVFKEEAPDFIFSTAAISDSRYCFYTQEKNNWHYTGVESLAGLHIGAIKSYSYGALIDAAIANNRANFYLQSGDNLTARLMRMLMAGRFDSFIENEYLVQYTLARFPDFRLREAGCESSSKTFIGFSPSDKIPAQKYADMFDSGIMKLRKNGELEKILARYGLRDWEQSVDSLSQTKHFNGR